jgi:uncharacterized phage-associated protein
MVSIFDVAAYILKQYRTESILKLQRLCYYAQAWYLVWEDEPLFEEDFYAWKTGPVNKEIQHLVNTNPNLEIENIFGDDNKLNEVQKKNIDKVLAYYTPHSASWLSQLSTMEEPWKQAREEARQSGKSKDILILKNKIASYYCSLARQ